MDFNSSSPFPEGVISFLDTDLYKLTMQCAVYKFFRDIPVTYAYTNRTPDKKLSRAAFNWLDEQIRSEFPAMVTRDAQLTGLGEQSLATSPCRTKNTTSLSLLATT
jgi:nicotinic acid phosphoribosyltransferase